VAATPAIAAAERAGIRFSLHEYEHDQQATSYGLEAVEKLDVEPERLFKTLVVAVDGELRVAHDLVGLTGARVHEIASNA
jgi:Cys-tRNA(Pro)/Cys-tRNA(Cys) deacylase